MLSFTGERIVPQADNCEPHFALKMYQEHIARYLFASQICAGKRVLDVGCGVGYGSHLLARSGAERVVAFDVSPETIDHARSFYAHPNLSFEVQSADSFHFDETFDVVTCFELIEHVDRQAEVLSRIGEALTPDGCLVISTPRPLGEKRSRFHTKELSPFEFLHLIESRFPYNAVFFENNHFSSLIDSGEPKEISRIHAIHRQFSLEQSDYMIVVASMSPVDPSRFRGQLVLNNDVYVLNLERDVAILHRSEETLVQESSAASRANEDLTVHLAAALSKVADLQSSQEKGQESLPALKARVDELLKENAVIFQENAALRDQNLAHERARTEFSSRLEAAERERQTLSERQRRTDLEREQTAAEQQRAVKETHEEAQRLRNQIAAQEHTQALDRAQIAELQERISAGESELAAKQNRIETLEDLLANGSDSLARLSGALAAAEEKILQMTADAAAATQARDELSSELEAAHQRVSEMQNLLEEWELRSHRQEARLHNLKAALATSAWAAAERDGRHSHELAVRVRTAAEGEAAVREYVASVHATLGQVRLALVEEHQKVAACREQLRTVLESRSWQMTSVLRSLTGGNSAEDNLAVIAPLQLDTLRIAPPASFDERGYLAANPDVAGAVEAGAFTCGFEHWLQYGAIEVQEGRRRDHRPARSSELQPAGYLQKGSLPFRAAFDVVYIIGCHDGESKRYRVHNLIDFLTSAGHTAAAFSEEDIPDLIQSEIHFQTLVIFRSAYHAGIGRLIEYARLRGAQTVFDVDDLIFEPENIQYVRVLSTFSPQQVAQYRGDIVRYREVLNAVDVVTCTTAYLAQRVEAAGARAYVIPNSINTQQMQAAEQLLINRRRNPQQVRIGYFSGSNTHQVDFRSCEKALLEIMDRHPQCRFVLVGILDLGPEWDRFADRIERHPILPATEMLNVLGGIDINLAPLEIGNPYCESKSQLKIFEAGLVEVPTIASSITSYNEAIHHEVDGFLASTEQEWIDAMQALVSSPELRRQMGAFARERALAQFGPAAVTRAAVAAYNLNAPLAAAKPPVEAPATGTKDRRLKISWIIPGLIIGGGGHRNILRAAYHLEQFGHELELYFTNTDLDSHQLKQTVNEHFYPLECPMHRYDGTINATDVLFATHWSTVDVALKARHAAGEVMYFVQDFEPLFAPMGTEYILAENTYRQGLYCITSGPWCEHLLRRDYNVEADHFALPVDSDIYHPYQRTKTETNILFFAKPEMPRRCYELGIMALEHVHHRRPDVEIQLFGSGSLKNHHFPFPVTIRSVLPTITDLARMYSNADAGIVFSTTNPSLVPYEMMSCGLPVVDLGREGNEVNYGGRLDIALLADPAPDVMAHQICDLLADKTEAASRSRKGLEFVKAFPSELQMARRVEELILRRVALKAI